MGLIPNIGLICFGIQFIFPLSQTLNILRKKDGEDVDYDTNLQWSIYWCVLIFFKFLESHVLYKIIPYIPLYGEFVFLLFLWLVLPEVKGPCWLWYNVIQEPFKVIDEKVMDAIEPILVHLMPKEVVDSMSPLAKVDAAREINVDANEKELTNENVSTANE